MKYVTLRMLLETEIYSNILKLKTKLLYAKREGLLFFSEDITSMGLDQKFELYYYESKGSIAYRNAFPVPANQFRLFNTHGPSLTQLSDFYRDYYEVQKINMSRYLSYKLFLGKQFVWIFRTEEANCIR